MTLELSQAGIPPHGTTLFRGNAWSSFIPFNFPVGSFVEMWGAVTDSNHDGSFVSPFKVIKLEKERRRIC